MTSNTVMTQHLVRKHCLVPIPSRLQGHDGMGTKQI